VPWEQHASTVDAVLSLKQRGYTVLAVELTDDSRDISTLGAADLPVALVLGNELGGVTDDVLTVCDGAVEIPMYGVKHSLNVAVAAGIALYAASLAWKTSKETL
jgi:tRNA G18 (ribose-2'-O)-methylase SpoU